VAVFLPVVSCGGSVTSRRLVPFSHPGPFLILSAANSFDDSLFTWIQIFLVMLIFCHATVAWQDTFIWRAVPQLPWVLFFLRSFLFHHATVA
jgi:hypothetical protein